MITLTLPEMVKKVSSMVDNQSVRSTTNKNNITISTDVWDFNFEYQTLVNCYLYDSITVSNDELDLELQTLKKTLMRELINKYGITNTFNYSP
jgi:hypothetical protein